MSPFIRLCLIASLLTGCAAGLSQSGPLDGTYQLRENACSVGEIPEKNARTADAPEVSITIAFNEWTQVTKYFGECTRTTHVTMTPVSGSTFSAKIGFTECEGICDEALCQPGMPSTEESSYSLDARLLGDTLTLTALSAPSTVCNDPHANDVSVFTKK